ncbi:IS3 family transposase [Yimella sp. cx-51]|nr:IS3 family transposase [Yimella sp. cx-51]
MADLRGVSRSGYYAWAERAGRGDRGELSPRDSRRADLVVKIKVAHDASKGVNGAPRITRDLRATGEVVSVKTAAKLMRDNEIRGISPRPWRPVTTIVDHHSHTIPDLVQNVLAG